MSKLLVLPLYRLTDANGVIIPNGRLYSYLEGTLTATPTYTTSALDVEHGPYVSANSAGLLPAIYLDPSVAYRFKVKQSVNWVTDPVGSDVSGMDFDSVGAVLASNVTYTPPGSGAVGSDVDAFLDRGPMYVESFRASGHTDAQTVAAAVAAFQTAGEGKLVFEAGRTYNLGSPLTDATLHSLTGLRNAILEGNGCTINVTTSADTIPVVFEFKDFRNVRLQNFNFQDLGYVAATTWRGAYFVWLNAVTAACEGFTFDNIRVQDAVAPVKVSGAGNRIRRIYITPNCTFTTVYYGVALINNGDEISGGYTVVNSRRGAIMYGVKDVDLDVHVQHNGSAAGGESCFLIKRYDANTDNVRLRCNFSGSLDGFSRLVNLEHQSGTNTSGDASARFDNIDIHINVAQDTTDTNGAIRLAFRSFQEDGTENVGTTYHTFGRIRLGGRLGNNSNPSVKSYFGTPVTPPIIAYDPDFSGFNLAGNPGTFSVPGFNQKVAMDRSFFEKTGDLTSGTLLIPLPDSTGFNGQFIARFSVEATHSDGSAGSSKLHYLEHLVPWYNSGGTASLVDPVEVVKEKAWNTSNFTAAWSNGANALTLTFGGSDYAVASARVKVEIEWLIRTGAR